MAIGSTNGSTSEERWNDAMHSWRREWTDYHRDPPLSPHHYTTADGLVGIVKSQRLYASHASYLNDATELVYAHSVIQRVLQEETATVASDAGRQLLADWQRVLTSTVAESEVYVACLCTAEDLLSQWRGYAGSTGGYSLGFSTDSWLDETRPPVVLRQIIYKPEEQEEWIRSLTKPVLEALASLAKDVGERAASTQVTQVLNLCQKEISECFFSFKHPKFEEELEWRIVYRPDNIMVQTERAPRLFRTRGDMIVPYVELDVRSSSKEYNGKLPISVVRTGPTVHRDLVTKSVVTLLEDHGYAAPNVLPSDVPLRA